jgi:hypothetical protein
MRLLIGLSANGLLVSVALAACGGASSSLGGGGGDGGSESSSGGSADTGTTGTDSGGPQGDSSFADTGSTSPSEAGASDTGTSETGPGTCAPLGAGATDVYVDQRYMGSMHTGVQSCPFTTITQGLTAAASLTGTRTVHVAGSTPALVYMEASSLDVTANVILSGDGPGKTTIQASGPCGNTTCAVAVGGGGVLEGFTVTCSGGSGIATSDGMPPPAVRAVLATGSKTDGLIAAANVDLGPGFSANANGAGGVESPAGAGGTIHVIGTTNTFDDNMGNGIDVSGTATLNFEGGTANGNFQGIRVAGATAAAGGHTITSLTASKNTGPGGVVAYNGQTIKMRSSTLTGNTGVGLYYAYVGSGTLDIGTANDSGGNTFAGATTADNNGLAGLRLCGVTAANMLTAAGDAWSACAPAQTFADCSTAPKNYSDIAYGPALTAAGVPVAVSGCTVGP